MIRAPETDFWQVGVLPAPIAASADPYALARLRSEICWMPEAGAWKYYADPFGIQRGETLHVFVEAFDYRTKHAVIEHHELGADKKWRGGATVLAQPVHLSYPFLIDHGDEVFMVPESHRAREIALYRARKFPDEWVKETVLLPDTPGAEPSLIHHHGSWWMFFTIVGPNARDQRELHVAFADRLRGPWRLHPQNPVLDERSGARPGGTPFVGNDDRIILPVQDCSRTYGGALNFLKFIELERDRIQIQRLSTRLEGEMVSSSYRDGLHTFSACGRRTLFDVKRIDRARSRHWIDLQRRIARLWR